MKFKEIYYLLKEETINDIRKSVDSVRKDNSEPVASNYISVNKQGTVTFQSTAITSPERYGIMIWTQKIKPLKKPNKKMTLPQFREVYNGDVLVQCDCPDFKYGGYEYIATQNDFKLGKAQLIKPDIRNPELKGSTCKHLYNALSAFKFNITSIRKDFNNL